MTGSNLVTKEACKKCIPRLLEHKCIEARVKHSNAPVVVGAEDEIVRETSTRKSCECIIKVGDYVLLVEVAGFGKIIRKIRQLSACAEWAYRRGINMATAVAVLCLHDVRNSVGMHQEESCRSWGDLDPSLKEKVKKFLAAIYLDIEYRRLRLLIALRELSIKKIDCCRFIVRRDNKVEEVKLKPRLYIQPNKVKILEIPRCILFCNVCRRVKDCLEASSI